MPVDREGEARRRASGEYVNQAIMETPQSTKAIPWLVIGVTAVLTAILILIVSLRRHNPAYFRLAMVIMAAGALVALCAVIYFRKKRFEERILITCMIGKGREHGDERWQ